MSGQTNWNWIGRFWIGIELELKAWTDRNWSIQSIHFQFNSSFYMVKHFFICHVMEIVVWQAIPCKQAYPHAPLCVPSMGSAGVFGHKGITITSITLRYFQCFNSLVMKSFFVTQKDHQLISPLLCHIASDNSLVITWWTLVQIRKVVTWWFQAITLTNVNWRHRAITDTSFNWWHHVFTWTIVDLLSVRIRCISQRKIS